ncbi:MAG: hypothetical protein IKA44_00760 [Clostridia bacterium]|nr:hypothetical protein [Clostridia bacterium]
MSDEFSPILVGEGLAPPEKSQPQPIGEPKKTQKSVGADSNFVRIARKKQPNFCNQTANDVSLPFLPKNYFKVFEILKNFFQKVFKWGLGQRPK